MGFLELQGLTKRYGTQAVVKDVSLSVDKGQLICLLVVDIDVQFAQQCKVIMVAR